MDIIREFLADYLTERGIKQSFIAEKTGIAPDTVSKILNGHRKILADEFLSICRALDIPQHEMTRLMSDVNTAKTGETPANAERGSDKNV